MTEVDLDAVVRDGLDAVATASDLDTLDRATGGLFGRRGSVSAAQRSLGQLDEGTRRERGRAVNEARGRLQAAIAERRAVLEDERDRVVLAAEAVDVTLPPRTPRLGSLHPIHETLEAMVDVFAGLGYTALTGPEAESEWFNFTALNLPRDHPARSEDDTIYLEPLSPDGPAWSTLLRTSTSPMQVRTMLAQPPPLYVVVPGRVYRQDTPDATHSPVFHQIEGLAVDTGITMADLRGTLAAVAREVLGSRTRIRLIPDHFPFTEPSCQVEAWDGNRWLELLGAGMVHPHVLRAGGYDPEQVGGFAFGIGIERVAMLRYGIDDMRLFSDNDLRFLAAF